jgi:hypothetical protein
MFEPIDVIHARTVAGECCNAYVRLRPRPVPPLGCRRSLGLDIHRAIWLRDSGLSCAQLPGPFQCQRRFDLSQLRDNLFGTERLPRRLRSFRPGQFSQLS